MHKMILVADSDPNMQVLLYRILGDAGYSVSPASDGSEVIARVAAERPSLVVANVELPGKSGVDVCRHIKSGPEPIPVVLIAPGIDPQPIEPADAVIGTPLDAGRVVAIVRGLLDAGPQVPRPSEKLLVIDDDLGILELLEKLLTREGYQVVTADNGREGIAAIPSVCPDLVLLDVQMPGVGGFETLGKIREDHPDLPVIMITGFGSEDVAAQALRVGADDYLSKPLRIRHVCFRIQSNLEKARLRASQEHLNRRLLKTTLELTERLETALSASADLRGEVARVLDALEAQMGADHAGSPALGTLKQLREAIESERPLVAVAALAAELSQAQAQAAGADGAS